MTALTKNTLRLSLRSYMRFGAVCRRCKSTVDGHPNEPPPADEARRWDNPMHDQLQKGGEYSRTSIEMLSQEEEKIYILKYGVTGFKLQNSVRVIGPMAVFPRSILHWNVKNSDDINEESLSLFTLLYPKPDILILGVGDIGKTVHPEVYKYLQSKRINIEVLPTDMACATFNFLNSEHRYVVGGLIPPEQMLSDFDRSFMSNEMFDPDSPKPAVREPEDTIEREQRYIMGNIVPQMLGKEATYDDPELMKKKDQDKQTKSDDDKKEKD